MFRSESEPRRLLRAIGVETSNLYTAFLALTMALLEPGGEMVSITPRSFCNGPYFRPFREALLREMSLLRLHVFDSRTDAFRDDEVLQENVILHAVKGEPQETTVTIARSETPDDPAPTLHELPFDRVVRPGDRERFLHLVPDAGGRELAETMSQLPAKLADLGLEVSTGRVVDFRARKLLRESPGPDTVPLIYPLHFLDGRVSWPQPGARKPNAILEEAEEDNLLVPAGIYVLVRRFSSKEERRRVVASLFDPQDVPCERVAFENHLNYFHAGGKPLDRELALGLLAFLNSSRVDALFRQFNGHTQVNATDLRALRYPSRASLVALGRAAEREAADSPALDSLVDLALAAELGG
jgi:adenine-specific DNA-methyltransferase